MRALILLLILIFPSTVYAGRYSLLISTSLEKASAQKPREVKSVLVKRSTPVIYKVPVIYTYVPPRVCIQCLH